MSFFDWLLSMRKKPIEERRRFVAVFTIIITACVTAVWLVLLVSVGPLKLKDDSEVENTATPVNIQLPELPPFPEMPDFSRVKNRAE